MSANLDILAPRARRKGLVIRDLDEEIVVFDVERNAAHCLNGAAAAVWRNCDGETTILELVEVLGETLGIAAGEGDVWHALLQLSRDHLLEEEVSRPAGPGLTRRQLMKRLGVAAAAASVTSLAIPAVGAHASVICGSTTCTGTQVCATCRDVANKQVCCNTGTIACCSSGTINCCGVNSGQGCTSRGTCCQNPGGGGCV